MQGTQAEQNETWQRLNPPSTVFLVTTKADKVSDRQTDYRREGHLVSDHSHKNHKRHTNSSENANTNRIINGALEHGFVGRRPGPRQTCTSDCVIFSCWHDQVSHFIDIWRLRCDKILKPTLTIAMRWFNTLPCFLSLPVVRFGDNTKTYRQLWICSAFYCFNIFLLH